MKIVHLLHFTIVPGVHRNHFRQLITLSPRPNALRHIRLLLLFIHSLSVFSLSLCIVHFNLCNVFYCWVANTLYDQTSLNENFRNVEMILHEYFCWIASRSMRDEFVLKCKTFFLRLSSELYCVFAWISGISTSVYSHEQTIRMPGKL